MNEYEKKVMEIADEITKEFKFKWYGFDNIAFIDHGDWADAEIIYKGITLNVHTVEDYFWEDFTDEYDENNYASEAYEEMFVKYIQERKEAIEEFILCDCEWNIKEIEAFILDNCTFKKNGRQIERFIKNHLSENVINDLAKEYNLQKTEELTEALQDFFDDYDYDFENECFSADAWEIEDFLKGWEFLPEDYEEAV